ncbi:MAG: sulfite oxidase [Ignavibacteriae bacterium]|nr:sulfite oxidase [Ignavibacteriota bacterium]
MSLFVVKHQHPAEACPAGNKEFAPQLLAHLAAENAGKFGITIHGEAVLNGKHTLYLIAEAQQQSTLEKFMQLFAQAGSVEILQASHCETVVERGVC